MSTSILLDVSFLAYRNHFVFKNLSFNDEPSGIIYGFFRDILYLKERFEPDRFVFCFDAGCGKRRELLPTYKSSRVKNLTEEEIKERAQVARQIQKLRICLKRVGFKNLFSQDGYEADDVAGSITKNSLTEFDDAVIVSSDGDLLQLLDFNVVLYNVIKKRCTNQKSFIKTWNVYPAQWPDVLALSGCETDCIPGIRGIGKATAAKWVAGDLNRSSKKFQIINQNIEIFSRNILLTRLPFPGTEVFTLRDDKIDKDEWQGLMKELGFNRIQSWV